VSVRAPFVPFAPEDCESWLPAVFERIVRTHGDRLAAEGARFRLTYAELNELADSIACVVRDATPGVDAPCRVALVFEHDVLILAAPSHSSRACRPWVRSLHRWRG
jgi:hypothetical protein